MKVVHVMYHKNENVIFATILEGPVSKEIAQEISKQLKEKFGAARVRFLPKLGPTFKPRTVIPVEISE